MRSRSEAFPQWTQPPALERRPLMGEHAKLIRRRIQLDAVPNTPSAAPQGRAFHFQFLVSWTLNSTGELTPAQLGQKTYRVNGVKLTEFIDKLGPGITSVLALLLRFLAKRI